MPRYTVKLIHSCGDQLDIKSGDDLGDILREYADEGSLADGDSLKIRDNADYEDEGDA
jgi:hypothetical protein